MAITYVDILIPSLSGLIGVSLGGIINLWAQKRSLRDEFIFKKKNELYCELLSIFRKEYGTLFLLKKTKGKKKKKLIAKLEEYSEVINNLQTIQEVYFSNKAKKIIDEYVLSYDVENLLNDEKKIEKYMGNLVKLNYKLSRVMKKELSI